MIGDPQIEVWCDGDDCCDSFHCGLTPTGRGWDDRNVSGEIESQDWTEEGDETFCPECTRERAVAAAKLEVDAAEQKLAEAESLP